MRLLAATSFVAIFFFAVPFPLIILAAAVIGYIGAKHGNPAFTAAGHGSAHEDGESLLGMTRRRTRSLPSSGRCE